MGKAKPNVAIPNFNKRRPKTKAPAHSKVTRKKLRDMTAASFQGQSFNDKKGSKKEKFKKAGFGNKSAKGKRLNRGEKAKKKLSQKLLKS